MGALTFPKRGQIESVAGEKRNGPSERENAEAAGVVRDKAGWGRCRGLNRRHAHIKALIHHRSEHIRLLRFGLTLLERRSSEPCPVRIAKAGRGFFEGDMAFPVAIKAAPIAISK